MMKRATTNLLLVIIVPLLTLLSACGEKDEPYVSNLEFSITIPVEWSYEEDINDSIRYYAASPYRPNDVTSGVDTVQEDMIIFKEYYPGTLIQYFVNTQQYYSDLLYEYDSISTEEIVINGYDFIRHISRESVWLPSRVDPDVDVEIELQTIRYFVMRDDYGYVIACASTTDTWDHYSSVFTTMVGTFAFKE